MGLQNEFDPKRFLHEENKKRFWAYLGVAIFSAIVFFFAQTKLLSFITPQSVKEERVKIENEIKQIRLSPIPYSVKKAEIEKLQSKLNQLNSDYPKYLWIKSLFESKYNKLQLFIVYAISVSLALSPYLILFLIWKKTVKPIAFQGFQLEPPLELGEFKELLNFSLAKIDKETFKNLFHSEKDYETFWRIVNANVLVDNNAGMKAVGWWIRDKLGKVELPNSNWKWERNLAGFFFSDLKPYSEVLKLSVKKAEKGRWKTDADLKGYVPAYLDFNEENCYFIAPTFKLEIGSVPNLPSEKKKVEFEIPFLLAKVGRLDINLISREIGRVLDELLTWAKENGIRIEDEKLFRARMGLGLYVWLANFFVKDSNIASGLVNKFVKDYVAKYLLSYLPSGLLLKPTNQFTSETRRYMFLYRTYRNPYEFSGLPIEDYLQLKYNLVFDIEQEQKAKEIKKKVGIYENYLIWN